MSDTIPNDPPRDDEIDLGKLFAVLWRGKMVIALAAFLALLLGYFVAQTTPRTYRADALVQLESRGGRMALPQAMSDFIDEAPASATEVEILRSRMILGQAVAELHLDWVARPRLMPVIGDLMTRRELPLPDLDILAPYARTETDIALDFLEVPPEWLGRDSILRIAGPDSYTITLPDGSSHDGVVGTQLRVPEFGYAIRVGTLDGPAGREFEIRQTTERSAINALRSGLTVSEKGRQSDILEVALTGSDPDEAQRRLSAIVRAYVSQNVSRSAAEAENSLEFIESQIPEARADVAAAERALNEYRQLQQSVDLSFETQALLSQIEGVESELLALQAREDELSQRFTPNHPEYQQLLRQRDRLHERLDQLRSEVEELPGTQREVLNLTRDLEIAQQILTGLLSRAQEVSVLRASTIGNVRVIDSAVTQADPIAPRTSLIVALSLILGGMAAMAWLLIRDWMRKGVQGAEEIEQQGLPVFATINYTHHADAIRTRDRTRRLPILAVSDPADLAVEAFRSLRTGLHFGMLDAATRSIAVTSAAPEAGKSFTSINLATVAAQAGQQVCLVDADLRRGQLRRYFGVRKHAPGLAEYLAGTATLDEVTVRSEVEGLSFIPTGRYPPNPSELLMRPAFADLVAALDTRCALTVIDSPPVLAVTDPVIIGRSVGMTLAVIRHDMTPIAEVQALKRSMTQAGVQIGGAVLNGFDPRRARAGYSYSYNYNYRYEYKSRSGKE